MLKKKVDLPRPVASSATQNGTELAQNKAFWQKPGLLALLGSILLAAIYGRVAIFNLTTGVIGGDLDGYENLWNNYWVKTALFDLKRNPFYTNYIYYPTGISLRFHTLNPFNGLLTLPFNLTLGWVATTNLLFLFSLATTTFFAFWLIRDIVGENWAAFAGAALFTYANEQVLGYFLYGQAEKLSAQWYPLYLFFMFRALGTNQKIKPAGRKLVLYIALSIITLIIISLVDWQYVIQAVVTTLAYFGFVLFTQRSWPEKGQIFLKLAAIGGIYAALIAIPLLLPMLREAADSPWLSVSEQSVFRSQALLDFVRPGLTNPGYLALLVGLVGLLVAWRRQNNEREPLLFWLLVGFGACILTLGPRLIWDSTPTEIRLPYALVYKLPVLSIGRDPGRFYIIAMLGFGIISAFGLKYLLNLKFFLAHRYYYSLFTILFIGVSLGGFVLEAGKAEAFPPDWPPFFEQIGQDKEDYAILELPLFSDVTTQLGRGEDVYEAYQVIHHKARFSGRLARDHKLTYPGNFVKKASFFHQLFWLVSPEKQQFYYPERDFLARTDYTTQAIPILNYYNVRYVIMYNEAISRRHRAAFEAVLKQAFGKDYVPFYQDKLMIVYKVPTAPAPANPVTLDVGEGWYAAQTENNQTYRWADNRDKQPSQLYTMNLTQQPREATFSFKLFSYEKPRTVKLQINGYEAGSFELKPEEGPKAFELKLQLPPGNNLLTFTTSDPPLPTPDPKQDARLLSFGASDFILK